MHIVHVKLKNGDELFAKLIGDDKGKLFLDDILCMEIIATETDMAMKYMFMVRWTAYNATHSMAIDKTNVLFVADVNEIVADHYRTSLAYAETVSDDRFFISIKEAERHLAKIIQNHKKEVEKSSTFSPSKTKH